MAPTRSGRPAWSSVTGPPAALAAYAASSVRRPTVCSASHLLKLSESLAPRKSRSSSDAPSSVRLTGAEKPRFRLSTGSSPRPSNTKVFSASSSLSTPSVAPPNGDSGRSTLLPLPTRPTLRGMRYGFLPAAGCFGVSLELWASVSVYVPAAASHAPEADTAGVPLCEYHSSNCDRSSPLLSAIAALKSSHVTACPSCRSKYRSIPFRKPSLPSSVWYMRTTSAPFSYTVTV
mmetsp:Transcript_11426/g.39727  ORF Transcript_11426/g.39727 Transcript_11426/m.39727 type:complete len:232 (+) Transcript_11426:516-1211(+)